MASPGIQIVKLIQLNIWQGRLLPQILTFLQREQPDFLCLQEVYSSSLNTPLLDFFCGLEHMQRAFPEYYSNFSPSYELDVLGQKVGFGNAIVSKFPLADRQSVFISGEFRSYANLDGYIVNTRTLQQATVQLANDKSLTLINHHGFWDKNPLGNDESVEKFQRVADEIAKVTGPIIFAGDMNLKPESPALQPLQEQLIDLTKTNDVRSTLSQFGKVSDVACDHIFVSGDVRIKNFVVSDALVSDHQALVLEFEL